MKATPPDNAPDNASGRDRTAGNLHFAVYARRIRRRLRPFRRKRPSNRRRNTD